jgi:hypothetical protein
MRTRLVKLRAQLAGLGAALAPVPPLVFEKLFFFGGLSSISYGMWLVYKPLGYVVGGLMGLWLASLISAGRHEGR